jgi:hypothetical protein
VGVNLAIDHLVLCSPTLADGDAELDERISTSSIEGGRHPGFGTENRISPLGDNYLEILSVADPVEAASNAFGRWATERSTTPLTVDAVCLRTSDLDSLCIRLGLEPTAMSRVRPDGVELNWRVAGVDRAVVDGLPFFIQWAVPDELLPGRSAVGYPVGDVALIEVVISGDMTILSAWVGDVPNLRLKSGPRAIRATFSTPSGEVSL